MTVNPVRPAPTRLSANPSSANRATPVRTPDYEALFKDGVFPITAGIGYDEASVDRLQREKYLAGLRSRGFEEVGPQELKEQEIDPELIDQDGRYFVKDFTYEGQTVMAMLKYIDRNTPNPVEQFGRGLQQRGLVQYGGHARYGSGPDWDDKESAEGNFVIGSPYDSQMREILEGQPNRLLETKLTDEYNLLAFIACKSVNYLDEIRSLSENKTTANLDFIGSNDMLRWSEVSDSMLSILDSLMAGEDVDMLGDKLVVINNGVPFTMDGFDDNPERPGPGLLAEPREPQR